MVKRDREKLAYYYIYKFAKDVENAPIDKLTNAILKTNRAEYIYRYAVDVKNISSENIDKLADAIIKLNDPSYILGFAIDVKNAPIDKLADAIIATNNAMYIYRFAFEVENAPIEKLKAAMEKTDEEIYKNAINKLYYSGSQKTFDNLINMAHNNEEITDDNYIDNANIDKDKYFNPNIEDYFDLSNTAIIYEPIDTSNKILIKK